ncbi:MAG: hypothetical protein AAB334_01150 [Patescibacteria group bacterium]
MKKKFNNEEGVPLGKNSEDVVVDPDAEIDENMEEISDEDEDNNDDTDSDF